MSEFGRFLANTIEAGRPSFQEGTIQFFGWVDRPTDGQKVGIFKEDIFGQVGVMTLENWKKAAEGDVGGFLEEDRKMAVSFAQRVVQAYPG